MSGIPHCAVIKGVGFLSETAAYWTPSFRQCRQDTLDLDFKGQK